MQAWLLRPDIHKELLQIQQRIWGYSILAHSRLDILSSLRGKFFLRKNLNPLEYYIPNQIYEYSGLDRTYEIAPGKCRV